MRNSQIVVPDTKAGSSHTFGKFTRTAVFATAVLSGCGGGGGSTPNAPTPVPPDATAPNGGVVIPGNGMIELGPVSGASVDIRTLDGQLITSARTASDGTFSYSIPADKRELMSKNDFVLVESRNGVDTDPTDSGNPATSTPRSVQGVVRGLVATSIISNGEKFRINPIAAQITEGIIKSGGSVTVDRVNKGAQEIGITDINKDGMVDYRDVLAFQMTKDTSPAKDAVQPFLSTLHSGNTSLQAQILETSRLRENLATINLVPGDLGNPSTELTKSPAAAKIIFTLDGSIPEPGTGTTRDYTNGSRFTYQNAELNYREVFLVNGKYEVGENKSFHLQHDTIKWSLENNTINSNASSTSSEGGIYQNGSYSIFIQYDILKEQRKYPAQMWVEIFPKEGYVGSNRYATRVLVYNSLYEQQVRAAFILATQDEIVSQKYQKKDVVMPTPTPPVGPTPVVTPPTSPVAPTPVITPPTPPVAPTPVVTPPVAPTTPKPTHVQNSQEVAYSQTIYKGGWIQVTYQWNLDGKSDYPVKVIGGYSLPISGRQTNKEALAQNANDLATLKSQLISQMQGAIDTEVNVQPKSQYTQNQRFETGNLSYRGGYYNVITYMNINGNADYPAKVSGVYRVPGGSDQTTIIMQVNNATELAQVQSERAAQMKAEIDRSIDDKYPAGYVETLQSNVSYNGGTYTVKFQYSTNSGKDYPGTVIIDYRLPTGATSNWSLGANNENEKTNYVQLGVDWTKSQIDTNQPPRYAPNTTTSTGITAYRIGNYNVHVTYNRMGTNRDFPALVYGDYYTGSGGGRKPSSQLEAFNESDKEAKKAQLIAEMQSKIPVHTPNDTISLVTQYRGGSYTIYTQYNRTNTDQDFPVMVWASFRLPGSTKDYSYAAKEVSSESALQNAIAQSHATIRAEMDKRIPLASYLTSEAKTQFANLVKGVQFFPSAHAAGNNVSSMNTSKGTSPTNSAISCSNNTIAKTVKQVSNISGHGEYPKVGYFAMPGDFGKFSSIIIFDPTSVPDAGVCMVDKQAQMDKLYTEIQAARNSLQAQPKVVYYTNGDIFGGYQYKNPEVVDKIANTLAQKLVEYSLLADTEFKKKYDNLVQAQTQTLGGPKLKEEIAKGIKDGMVKAVKEYITGYTDLVNLSISDLVSAVREIGKSAVDIVSKGIDINKIASGASTALTEAYDVLSGLPNAISNLGVYEKSMFGAYISAYIGIEAVDPLKKTVGLLKGFQFPGMATAQFLWGKAYIGNKATNLDEVKHFLEWNKLALNKRIVKSLDNIPENIRNAAKLGSAKLTSLAGHEYSFNPEKIKQHMKNSGKYATGKSYFLESMSENDVYNLTMEVMNKLSKEQWKDILNSGGKGLTIQWDKVIGLSDTTGNGTWQQVSRITVQSKANGIMHIIPEYR